MKKKIFHSFSLSKTGLIFAAFSSILLVSACTADQLSESTVVLACSEENVVYDNQIEHLLTTYCNLEACHGAGSSQDDYTTYANLSGILNESGFQNRVIDTPVGESTKMPPPYTEGPKTISEDELELIQCWIDQGYPEN